MNKASLGIDSLGLRGADQGQIRDGGENLPTDSTAGPTHQELDAQLR